MLKQVAVQATNSIESLVLHEFALGQPCWAKIACVVLFEEVTTCLHIRLSLIPNSHHCNAFYGYASSLVACAEAADDDDAVKTMVLFVPNTKLVQGQEETWRPWTAWEERPE